MVRVSLNAWPESPAPRQNGVSYTMLNFTTLPCGIRWSRATRSTGTAGWKLICPSTAGGTVTTTRRAYHVVPSTPCTATRSVSQPVTARTARPVRIRSGSRCASRSATSCEPPTIRSCWAPPTVSVIRFNPPPAAR